MGIILLLSVPVFYIIGLIAFISWLLNLSSKKSSEIDRRKFLEKSIQELSGTLAQSPGKKISDQIDEYKTELENLTNKKYFVPAQSAAKPVQIQPHKVNLEEPKPTLGGDIEQFWSNWYSENSINLLLYIGAFLIVASASIFVGFQWETIGGTAKAFLISFLTLAFFGFGIWFYQLPKIKNAGSTFTAIGALLIPFCGLAWYNFVFRETGVSFGWVWLTTSLVALLTYAFLAFFMRNAFYTYISSLGTLSLVLSLINVYQLNREFYVLGGVFSAFIILIGRQLFVSGDQEIKSKFSLPLEVSSNIITPVSLIYGLLIATSSDKLFTFEATLALFMGAAYYFFSYIFVNKAYYLAIAEILFPLAVVLFFKWQGLSNEFLLYTLNGIALFDLALSYLFKRYSLKEESEANIIISIAISVLVFFTSLALDLKPIHLTIFAFLPVAVSTIATVVTKRLKYLAITSIFLAITIYIYLNRLLGIDDKPYIISMVYLLSAVGFYALSVASKRAQSYLQIFSLSTVLFFALSVILSLTSPGYLLIVSLVLTAVLFAASFQFSQKNFIYASNASLFFSLLNFLRFVDVSSDYYPLAFSGLSYVLYLVSQVAPNEFKDKFRISSFVGILATPILFGLYAMSNPGYDYSYDYRTGRNIRQLDLFNILERNSLISAYGATILFAIDSTIIKSRGMGYFASAIGMATYLWQIKFLGITEAQTYTLPLAVYFMVLAYLRRIVGDLSKRDLLDFAGLFFLILPTLMQSFGNHGAKYSLLFGVEGAILIALGTSLKYKTYIYAGVFAIVAAVISQTYEYVFSLPRWIITGVAGLAFLSVAIYLLLHRKEEPEGR